MTLTELSYYSRRLLPFGIICFFLLLIFYYAARLFIVCCLSAPQQTTAYINPRFGKIAKPQLTDTNKEKFTYSLDTIEGQPLTATDTASVYFLPPNTTKLGYKQKVNAMAKQLGINVDDESSFKYELSVPNAKFSDSVQDVSIDITNFNFTYQYNIKNDSSLAIDTVLPSKEEIQSQAINFLTNLDRYPQELAQGKINVIYFDYNTTTQTLTTLTDSVGANMVEVDFYRPDIDQFPVVSPKYFNSQNYVVMVFNQAAPKVVRAPVKFFDKSTTESGIYPVKTGDVAWQEMQEGKGYVVSSSNESTKATIKRMFMGYLDPDIYQDYLQPVYVFLGDNNFVGYVPAVSNTYLSE